MLRSDAFWLVAGLAVGTVLGVGLGGRAAGPWWRRLALAAACAHIGAVVAVTMFPMPIAGAEPFAPPYEAVQLEPFATIRLLLDGSQGVRQLGGNLALLAPMGVLVPLAWPRARPFTSTVAVGFVTSVLIELLQFGAGVLVGEFYRVVDVDDVLLNSAGVLAGRVLFGVLHAIWRVVAGPEPDRVVGGRRG